MSRFFSNYSHRRNEIVFLGLCVRSFFCLSAKLLKKLWTDYDEILEGWAVAQGPSD